VKVFHHSKNEEFTHERNVLERLAKIETLGGRISKLAAQHTEAPANVLYLEPIGTCLAVSAAHYSKEPMETAHVTPVMLTGAVETLRLLHTQARLGHRDVRPSNMFLDPSTGLVFPLLFRALTAAQLFINDLGSAAALGQPTQFTGALQHAPVHVIVAWSQGARYMPAPADDLEMLVWTAFELAFPLVWSRVYLCGPDADGILRVRAGFLPKNSLWHRLLGAASAANYALLSDELTDFLTSFYPNVL
jgi:hypothetical protein